MKSIIFDSGPIISLTTNNLLWLLEKLKKRYSGEFYIPSPVKREIIDRPLAIKRFKFEALQVLHYIKNGTLNVIENEIVKDKTLKLLDIANKCFKAHGNWIQVVHYAEIAGIVACLHLNSDAFVVDERTTRVLIEDPKN